MSSVPVEHIFKLSLHVGTKLNFLNPKFGLNTILKYLYNCIVR